MIECCAWTPQDTCAWSEFLRQSNNGTLFHNLDFLAYHADGKFETRHLLFHEDGRLVALLPAAIVADPVGRRLLKSPYGASVGGFVLPLAQPAEQTRILVSCLQEYAARTRLDGVEFRIAPGIYMQQPHEHLGFALLAGGFRLVRRYLCHAIALPGDPQDVLGNCKKPKVRDYRMGVRRGLQPFEASPDRLADFYRVLLLNEAKHEAVPTHTQEELVDLFQRVPSSMRLFLCEKDGQVAAGILIFILNARVPYTFYIAQDDSFKALCPVTALIVHIAEQMSREGFTYLDLGPTTFDDLSFNSGLATFKEGFGARGYCRDTWRWDRE